MPTTAVESIKETKVSSFLYAGQFCSLSVRHLNNQRLGCTKGSVGSSVGLGNNSTTILLFPIFVFKGSNFSLPAGSPSSPGSRPIVLTDIWEVVFLWLLSGFCGNEDILSVFQSSLSRTHSADVSK
jgi:hypothetical protein